MTQPDRLTLPSVTLLGIDCVDIERLILASEICKKHFNFGAVKLLTSLKTDHPDAISIAPINSIEEYSRFAIAELDSFVETPHVLIIQYDGFILNPAAWTDDFLTYDYIGAPWDTVVGNGGFSLRSKKLTSLCARLARDGFFKEYHPEDTILSITYRKELEAQGIKFAPAELARRFSFESSYQGPVEWSNQFGFHGLRWTDISKWLDQNPEYKSKINNKLDDWAMKIKLGRKPS